MTDEVWKLLGAMLGGGGLVAIVTAVLKHLHGRRSQAIGLHRADLQAQGLILDRQGKRVTELERKHGECVEHHVECLEANAKLQGEMGALREAVRRVDIAATSAVAVVVANAEGAIVQWNEGAVTIFHWTFDEAVGQPITLLTPKRYLKRHLAAFRAIVEAQKEPDTAKCYSLYALTREQREVPITLKLSGWQNGKGWLYAAEISRA